MNAPIHLAVTDAAIVLAPAHLHDTGLLAWATVIVGPFRIDGLAVRRTGSADLAVTWPMRKDGRGELHPTVAVLDDRLKKRVEASVLIEYLEAAGKARGTRR